MSKRRDFFTDLNQDTSRVVKFGDNSKVKIEGRGSVFVCQRNGQTLKLGNVLYVPQLRANILNLGHLDEEGCKMIMHEGWLTIFNQDGHLLTEVEWTKGGLYLLKLNVIDSCRITKEEEKENWL